MKTVKLWAILCGILGVIYVAFYIGKTIRNGELSEPIIQRDTIFRRELIRDTVKLTETRFLSRIDTIVVQLPGDTTKVAVSLQFERKTYATENYRLDITGYKPELESIEVFPVTKEIIQNQFQNVRVVPTWQAGVVIGAQAVPGWHNEYLGARARYNSGRFNFEATIGYNPWENKPYGEVKVGFDIIKK